MAATSAILDRPIAVVVPFPAIEQTDTHPEYRYELIWERGEIVGARIPWLKTPEEGVITDGQKWFVVDDDKHANPISGLLPIRFRKNTQVPGILIDERTGMCLEAFLREILNGTVVFPPVASRA